MTRLTIVDRTVEPATITTTTFPLWIFALAVLVELGQRFDLMRARYWYSPGAGMMALDIELTEDCRREGLRGN